MGPPSSSNVAPLDTCHGSDDSRIVASRRRVVYAIMADAVTRHWPEYLIEAAGLGLFMISASVFALVLFHPGSPAAGLAPLARRMLMGVAMGLTAVGLIYSPWGQQSGAHFNPAVTLTFLRLGLVAPWDATFY